MSVESYLGAWGTNFVMAVPLNCLFIGPLSRFILGRIQKACPSKKAEDFEDDDELSKIILGKIMVE